MPVMNDKPLLLFHVLESEAEKAVAAMSAAGIKFENGKPMKDEQHAAFIAALDKIVPGAKLVERAQQATISIAVLQPGKSLPDNRYQPDPRAPAFATMVDQAPTPDQVPAGMGIIAARAAPTPALQKKLGAVEVWEPLPEHTLQQIRQAATAEGMPYPTHQGVISLDGKATIKVYQLSNGERVIDAQDLHAFFSAFGGL